MFFLIMKGNIRPHCRVLSLFFKIKDAVKYTGIISLVVIISSFIKGMANEIPLDYRSTSATVVLEMPLKWTPRDGRDFGSWTTLFLFCSSYPGSSNSLINIHITRGRLSFLKFESFQ